MRSIKTWVRNEVRRLEWYVCAKPYRYIMYSLVLNLLESVMLLWLFLRLR
jgi:hypothetical protein